VFQPDPCWFTAGLHDSAQVGDAMELYARDVSHSALLVHCDVDVLGWPVGESQLMSDQRGLMT